MKKLFGLLMSLMMASTMVFGQSFEGKGQGVNGEIVIKADFDNNKLLNVEILKESESDFSKQVMKNMIKEMIDTQNLDLDDVAGVSMTTQALKNAVKEAADKGGVKLEKITQVVTEKKLDNNADVVVIGGGGAGISAALSAYENGAKVILIEKTGILGGNTNYATAGLNAANTKLQKKLGINDSVELFVEDTMKGGKQKNNKELVEVLAKNSSGTVDWLVAKGVDLSELTTTGGQSVKRTHRPTGGAAVGPEVVGKLSKVVEDDKIDTRYSTRAIELVKKGNRIVGVKVNDNGKEYIINAKAVIIATGGFGANAELVEKYNPNLKGFGTTNNPAIVGDAIEMVEKVGGAFVDMNEIQTHPTVLHNKGKLVTEAVRGEGGILVNQDGKRFIDELETRDVVSKAILNQPGKVAYIVFNEDLKSHLGAAAGYVKKGYTTEGTLTEVSKKLGINEKNLKETLDKYNSYVKANNDEEFGRKSMARELTGDKYYLIPVSPAVHHTMGGIKINSNAEVIGKNGRPIKGLYAAGEVTGGVHGANRIGGNAMADITVYGKIAGENATTYSKSIK